jgi:prophage tail gpP-like protein
MSGTEAEIPATLVTAARIGAGEDAVLRIEGRDYAGWTAISVTRSMEQGCATFTVQVVERWKGQGQPWQIEVFKPVEVLLGSDVVLTGYVDKYAAQIDAASHTVTITGRSKTADLVDCTAVPGELRGNTLEAIARSAAAPYGIDVIAEGDAGAVIPLAAPSRDQPIWSWLEELARSRGVLLTDDDAGRLVLAQAGEQRAPGQLVIGQNVLAANGELDGAERFSTITVIAQLPPPEVTALQPAAGEDASADPTDAPAPGVSASATDPNVPRPRERVIIAERALTAVEAKARAIWEAKHAAGRGARAQVTLRGWRDADGAIWCINRVIACDMPALQLLRDMLIVGVTFSLDANGRTTDLELAPPECFAPKPVAASEDAPQPAPRPRRLRAAGNGTEPGGMWGEVVPIE